MVPEKKIGEKFLFGRKRLHLVCIEKDGCKECFMKDGRTRNVFVL